MITNVSVVGDAVIAEGVGDVSGIPFQILYRGSALKTLFCLDKSYYSNQETYRLVQTIKANV